MVSSPEIIWQCELTDTLKISSCGPRWQEHPVWRQEQGLQACWVIPSLDVLENSFSAHSLNSSFLSSPIGSESSISHQKAQGKPSSSLVVGGNESKNTVRGRVKMRGQNHHTENHLCLPFYFFWSVSTPDLWDIVGLQVDKNGNTRPRQPGGKDTHGKLQSLLGVVFWDWVSLMSQSAVSWKWLPGEVQLLRAGYLGPSRGSGDKSIMIDWQCLLWTQVEKWKAHTPDVIPKLKHKPHQ